MPVNARAGADPENETYLRVECLRRFWTDEDEIHDAATFVAEAYGLGSEDQHAWQFLGAGCVKSTVALQFFGVGSVRPTFA